MSVAEIRDAALALSEEDQAKLLSDLRAILNSSIRELDTETFAELERREAMMKDNPDGWILYENVLEEARSRSWRK